jgi:hypothetical protein
MDVTETGDKIPNCSRETPARQSQDPRWNGRGHSIALAPEFLCDGFGILNFQGSRWTTKNPATF